VAALSVAISERRGLGHLRGPLVAGPHLVADGVEAVPGLAR